MLVIRAVPGAGQFDPIDPNATSGGWIDLPVPASGDSTQWKILSAGYNSIGAPHTINITLTPPGALVLAGGPSITLATASAANTLTLCPIWIPRSSNTESWSIRIATSGKTDLGTLAVNLALLGVTG
jgi:hypothetical protein